MQNQTLPQSILRLSTMYPSEDELNLAIALNYDGNTAPKVVAKGDAELAQQIVALANEHSVPICDNPALAQLLYALEIGEEIPQDLYLAVAHIIAFAYKLEAQLGADAPLARP